MKKLMSALACVSLSAQAFVCGNGQPPRQKIIQESEVDMLADISVLDTPESIKAKKEYEKAVISVVGTSRINDIPTDDQENEINEAVIAYEGPADLKAITSYVKSLPSDVVVKSYAMTSLAQGQRADCFELNDLEYRDILKYRSKACEGNEQARRLFPDTFTVDIKSVLQSRKVCSSTAGARPDCRSFPSSSCDPTSCR